MIINLTQHRATPEQVKAGVVDLPDEQREELSRWLTFDEIPDPDGLNATAHAVARMARDAGADAAMIGGAPFFMPDLERVLRHMGVTPVYAFSRRESVEVTDEDGNVRKTAVFRHMGFVKTDWEDIL